MAKIFPINNRNNSHVNNSIYDNFLPFFKFVESIQNFISYFSNRISFDGIYSPLSYEINSLILNGKEDHLLPFEITNNEAELDNR